MDAPSTRIEQARFFLLCPLHHVVAARLGKPSLLISLHCNCNACTWSERQAAAANARTKRDVFTVVGGAGQRARWRHCGAPILRRYATTSAFFWLMAYWSAVPPPLQRRKCAEDCIASGLRAAAPVPRGDVCFRRHQQAAYFQTAIVS